VYGTSVAPEANEKNAVSLAKLQRRHLDTKKLNKNCFVYLDICTLKAFNPNFHSFYYLTIKNSGVTEEFRASSF